MNNNYLVAGGVALAISLVVALTVHSGSVQGPPGKNGADGKTFGALAGPDIPSPYLRWGSVATFNAGMAATATSSAFCAVQAPAATSSIVFLSWRMDSIGGFASTQTFDISTSSSGYPFGSSTPALVYGAKVIGNDVSGSIIWSGGATTSSAGVASTVLTSVNSRGDSSLFVTKPNEWVVWRMATATPGTFASPLTGNCQVQFIPL